MTEYSRIIGRTYSSKEVQGLLTETAMVWYNAGKGVDGWDDDLASLEDDLLVNHGIDAFSAFDPENEACLSFISCPICGSSDPELYAVEEVNNSRWTKPCSHSFHEAV